jgi:hypothetical protein
MLAGLPLALGCGGRHASAIQGGAGPDAAAGPEGGNNINTGGGTGTGGPTSTGGQSATGGTTTSTGGYAAGGTAIGGTAAVGAETAGTAGGSAATGGTAAAGGAATAGTAAGGAATAGTAIGGATSLDPCSPSSLAAEGLSGPDLVVEAKFAAPPPAIQLSDEDPIITDQASQTLVYGTLLSTSPVQFSSDGYKELTYWYSLDCRVRPQQGAQDLGWAQQTQPSCLDDKVGAQVGSSGYFWADSRRCCIYAYRPQLANDQVLVTSGSARFYRQARYFFSGELLGLTEDMPPSAARDMRKRYPVRVDTVYLQLGGLALSGQIETEVIGWIPPKRGKVYFWGNPIGPSSIVLSSYIAANPRPAWFCPTSGRYQIQIASLEKGSTICSTSGGACKTSYTITGTIVETLQGRVATGQTVTFNMEDPPPRLVAGGTFQFVGVAGTFSVDD